MKNRTALCILGIILAGSAAGGAWGGRLQTGANSREAAEKLLRNFSLALRVVEENYADPVSPDKAIFGAIQAMLGKLDPRRWSLSLKPRLSLKTPGRCWRGKRFPDLPERRKDMPLLQIPRMV